MIEIELFYKIVEAQIRKNHGEYLEREKREVMPVVLPRVDELPHGKEWKKLGFFARLRLQKQRKKQLKAYKKAEKKQREVRVADKLLKGYNAGVKSALDILKSEFKEYIRRFKSDDSI